jgi:hypothetical protein
MQRALTLNRVLRVGFRTGARPVLRQMTLPRLSIAQASYSSFARSPLDTWQLNGRKKGGGKEKGEKNDRASAEKNREDDGSSLETITKTFEANFQSILNHLENELSALKVGRTNPGALLACTHTFDYRVFSFISPHALRTAHGALRVQLTASRDA